MQLLTATSLGIWRKCPRAYFYRIELGLSPKTDATPLRIGTAFHAGMAGKEVGLITVDGLYAATPGADAYEHQTVRTLVYGHQWRWGDSWKVLASEATFQLPLVNPATGRSSRRFTLAGKLDAFVTLPDSRLAVVEYKTAGEDISPESDYWPRLRCDPQIAQYILGARALGFEPACVMYDVTRKPTISPGNVPLLDENDLKVVLDVQGQRVMTKQGKPRQTSDTALGYVLQVRPETPDEWAGRLWADMVSRPDHYFARREIPILDDELARFQAELWQQAGAIGHAGHQGCWYRNVGRWTCPMCTYSEICLNGIQVGPDDPAPAGFLKNGSVHPELDLD